MKTVLIPLLIIMSIAYSCKQKAEGEKNKYVRIFENIEIKKSLTKLIDSSNTQKGSVFKLKTSRCENFVRITIHQIFYDTELEQLPSDTVTHNNRIYLVYDGSEILFNKIIERKHLDQLFIKKNIILKKTFSTIYNPRVLQFDYSKNGVIKLNFPPISPYGENIKMDEVKFVK
ncbi:hypothetical protein [Flavobacterium sp.]|uniref:hypothetical protein n=1 Tax=Flavobacterium sp. TaxID=239 RepID=UPI00286E35B8|nr:hypothetical protein [Flavobacterium sp.]